MDKETRSKHNIEILSLFLINVVNIFTHRVLRLCPFVKFKSNIHFF